MSRKKTTANTPNTAPAATAAAPRAKLVAFSTTSLLASSISSWTSFVRLSETSVIAAAMLSCCPLPAAKALKDRGQYETANECDADNNLGTLTAEGYRPLLRGR